MTFCRNDSDPSLAWRLESTRINTRTDSLVWESEFERHALSKEMSTDPRIDKCVTARAPYRYPFNFTICVPSIHFLIGYGTRKTRLKNNNTVSKLPLYFSHCYEHCLPLIIFLTFRINGCPIARVVSTSVNQIKMDLVWGH